jgi:hypothetical protein
MRARPLHYHPNRRGRRRCARLSRLLATSRARPMPSCRRSLPAQLRFAWFTWCNWNLGMGASVVEGRPNWWRGPKATFPEGASASGPIATDIDPYRSWRGTTRRQEIRSHPQGRCAICRHLSIGSSPTWTSTTQPAIFRKRRLSSMSADERCHGLVHPGRRHRHIAAGHRPERSPPSQ